MNSFVERHQDKITGVLGCFDRIVISATLPEIGFAGAATRFLSQQGFRVFDYTQWAEPLRDELRTHAERVADEAGLEIEFIRRYKSFRKEDRIKAILAKRGEHPGLVHIFSAMESCSSYRPWHDKVQQTTGLRSTQGKCLHYDFYFIDEHFGLCYLRVPTWSPFRLQIYLNGHSWLARQLERAQVGFAIATMASSRSTIQIMPKHWRMASTSSPCINTSIAGHAPTAPCLLSDQTTPNPRPGQEDWSPVQVLPDRPRSPGRGLGLVNPRIRCRAQSIDTTGMKFL